MAFADIDTIQTLNSGDILLAATLQQINSNFDFLIDPPSCSVYHSTTQSVANTALAALNADSETFDNDSMHSTSTNTSRITAQTAGRYLVTAQVMFDSSSTGIRLLAVRVNGTTTHDVARVSAASAGTTRISGTKLLVLSASDYVETVVQHSAGSNLNVTLAEFGALYLTR